MIRNDHDQDKHSPVHPSTHGVMHLVVDLEGDTIVNVEPHVGFLHRGVEKLAENRMYMQIPPYMEKLDYVGSDVVQRSLRRDG